MILQIFWNNNHSGFYDLFSRLRYIWITSGGIKKSSTPLSWMLGWCVLHRIGVDCYSKVYLYMNVIRRSFWFLGVWLCIWVLGDCVAFVGVLMGSHWWKCSGIVLNAGVWCCFRGCEEVVGQVVEWASERKEGLVMVVCWAGVEVSGWR